MEVKNFKLTEQDLMGLSKAIEVTLKEKNPMTLTITKCAKVVGTTIEGIFKEKQAILEKVGVKDEQGEYALIEGLEGGPMTIFDYQLSIPEKEVEAQLKEIFEKDRDVELPIPSGDSKILVNKDMIVTLEEYLDMSPDVSSSLAYIYLTLTS